ncbi:MAG: tetratricopeptide repeat protein [Nitrosomonadales bacterium]|nr:tetratricopeptide repeat protein [Nitrosomonadales bacterium]
MSLINQMLSDLEKRGAHTLPGEPAIRPVSVQNRPRKILLPSAIAALVLLSVLAGIGWNRAQPKVAVVHADAQPAPLAVPQTQPQPQPQPSVADTKTRPPEKKAASSTPPASHMSFALSAITPHAAPHHAKPPTTASAPSLNKTAPDATPAPIAMPSGVDKKIRPLSAQQQADNEFLQANNLMQQGRSTEAINGYESALRLDASHAAARQSLVGLLLEAKRNADAERVLQEGLDLDPAHGNFAMLLARLQVERGALPQALETLHKTLPYAGQQADYHAFIAAVQQRLGQHQEAVAHYQSALQLSPDSGVWLMGLGISLQAMQHNDEAREAFRHAIESHTLNAELQAFVAQRLKEL